MFKFFSVCNSATRANTLDRLLSTFNLRILFGSLELLSRVRIDVLSTTGNVFLLSDFSSKSDLRISVLSILEE